MADFIELHGRYWRVVWDVPQACRGAFNGKRRLKQSLGTESRKEAVLRAAALVAAWKLRCEQATGEGDVIAARAAFFRDHLRQASTPEERDFILERIADVADDIDPGDPEGELAEDRPRPDAERFYKLATEAWTEIKPLIEPWLASRKVAEKTKDMDRSTLHLLLRHHKIAQDVDRKAAARFVENVLLPDRSEATVRRMLSGLSRFWTWMQDRGELPADHRNPWSRQAPPKPRNGNGGGGDGRRPFTEEEASAFLSAIMTTAKKHPADPVVVMLMAVTGARLEEIAGLARSDVMMGDDVAWLTIREGKTEAAKRRIPVVAPTVLDALRPRLDGDPSLPVFPELGEGRYGKLSQALSKRLGRLLRQSVKDPSLVAAHSWRHRARTLAERAGIQPWVADAFFGHKRPGEGLGRYSQGPSEAQLLDVATAIPLPSVPSA